MTQKLAKMLAIRPELEKAIYERFPISKEEKEGCETEKAMRDAARVAYGEKLMKQPSKKEYE